MKRVLLLLGLTILITSAFSKAKFQEATLINTEGDTIKSTIQVSKEGVLSGSKRIKCKENGSVQYYNAEDIDKIVLGDRVYEKLIITKKKQVQQGHRKVWIEYETAVHAEMIVNGNAKLYCLYSGKKFDYYLDYSNEVSSISSINFKNDCFDRLNCSEVVAKFKYSDLVYRDVKTIIECANSRSANDLARN